MAVWSASPGRFMLALPVRTSHVATQMAKTRRSGLGKACPHMAKSALLSRQGCRTSAISGWFHRLRVGCVAGHGVATAALATIATNLAHTFTVFRIGEAGGDGSS